MAIPVAAAPTRHRVACVPSPPRAARVALTATLHVCRSYVSLSVSSLPSLPLRMPVKVSVLSFRIRSTSCTDIRERFSYRCEASATRRGPVSHDYLAGLGRLRLDEIEGKPFVDATEERLTFAQDDRVDDQPKLIDQVLVQEACDEGSPADDIRVLPRLAFERSNLGDVPDDLHRGPRDALEARGQNNVPCLSSQPCVRDLTLRGDSVLEWRDTVRVGVDRLPVLAVGRVHVSAQDEHVDVRDQLDCVGPGVDPVLFSIWSLGEAIQRDLKCSDHRSGCVGCHDSSFANRLIRWF